METGLSNLTFSRLNLSSMRSCEREEVELDGKGQEEERQIRNEKHRVQTTTRDPVRSPLSFTDDVQNNQSLMKTLKNKSSP